MSFHFGETSEANLVHVESGLVRCARRALVLSTQDFGVYEGIRMLARQRLLVASGASRTLDSYHIPDDEGVGHALDLLPFIDGRMQWQFPLELVVAAAMHKASLELAVPITWGGVLDRRLGDLDPRHLASEVQRYRARYYAAHPAVWVDGEWHQPEPLIDGPHFQGVRPKKLAA